MYSSIQKNKFNYSNFVAKAKQIFSVIIVCCMAMLLISCGKFKPIEIGAGISVRDSDKWNVEKVDIGHDIYEYVLFRFDLWEIDEFVYRLIVTITNPWGDLIQQIDGLYQAIMPFTPIIPVNIHTILNPDFTHPTFVDLNFDGFLDLRIWGDFLFDTAADSPILGEFEGQILDIWASHYHFVWDNDIKQFVRNEDFDKLISVFIIPDEENQTWSYWWYNSGGTIRHITETFGFVEDEFVRVSTDEGILWPIQDYKLGFLRTLTIRDFTMFYPFVRHITVYIDGLEQGQPLKQIQDLGKFQQEYPLVFWQDFNNVGYRDLALGRYIKWTWCPYEMLFIRWEEVIDTTTTSIITREINQNLPPFIFYFQLDTQKIIYDYYFGQLYKITILITDQQGAKIQYIDGLFQSTTLRDWKKLNPRFEDLNGDGYFDMHLLKIQDGVSGTGTRYVWLWDIEKGRFVLHEQLMDIVRYNLSFFWERTPLSVDWREGRLVVVHYDRKGHWAASYYTYKDGEFTHVTHTIGQYIFEPTTVEWRRYREISDLLTGKVTIVKEEIYCFGDTSINLQGSDIRIVKEQYIGQNTPMLFRFDLWEVEEFRYRMVITIAKLWGGIIQQIDGIYQTTTPFTLSFWQDFNNDGYLDLVLEEYIKWTWCPYDMLFILWEGDYNG